MRMEGSKGCMPALAMRTDGAMACRQISISARCGKYVLTATRKTDFVYLGLGVLVGTLADVSGR
ncbi:hypothetical protein [Paraburkholderia sp. SIMBA_030]|uniref:hypothetical protein n=1 Tax=Paraburkholderia sp. SIMBA_030 TaxID=3085773 RepID=UPI00397D2AA4